VTCLAGLPLALKRGAPQASHEVCDAREWVKATHPLMQQSTHLVSSVDAGIEETLLEVGRAVRGLGGA